MQRDLTDEQWYDLAQRHAAKDWSGFDYPELVKAVCRDYAALASAPAAEPEPADEWRRLALQFDYHRMQALAHLRQMLAAPMDHADAAAAFLAAPPLAGEKVLAERIAALAQASHPQAQVVATQTVTDAQILEAGSKWSKAPGFTDFERNDFISCVRELLVAHGATSMAGKAASL